MRPLILIPARYAATRLPGKPLADIAGKPMIVHVLERAKASGVGRVVIATDTPAIKAAVHFDAVMTRTDHPSGSDRIFEALQKLDPQGEHDVIINLQGDMPTLDPAVIREVLKPLADPRVDIATLAAEIHDEAEEQDPAVVKAWITFSSPWKGEDQGGGPLSSIRFAETRQPSPFQGEGVRVGRAVNFSRTPPPGGRPFYHHIGIYAYRREALERFVNLPPSPREKAEKLEQLRALEAGMRIDIAVVDTVPLGVDTLETLEKARAYYAAKTTA